MSATLLSGSARLKVDLLFQGLRYTEPLGHAAPHSFPNFMPYRFAPDEPDPTGSGSAPIPYMLFTGDDTHARIKCTRGSPWWISGSLEDGYALHRDGVEEAWPVAFEPACQWMSGTTADGLPRAQAGLSLHGDMAVVNVAPGCDYFLAPRRDGRSMRCTFCTYGAPNERTAQLGQVMGRTALPDLAYARLQEVLRAALEETPIRHIYLVGGSLTDPREEGIRYMELARRVQEVVDHRVPITCGSGALPEESLRALHAEGLVDAVCFNLEVWSEPLFAQVCPGKHHYVGYDGWIASLERAVSLWGRERVYTAMVAGVELGPDVGMPLDEAADLAIRGAEDLCRRGILPIYSLYWPPPGHDLPEQLAELRTFFERLQLAYSEIRRREGLSIWEGFMCHRCAYMQLECDVDRSGERRREVA